MRRLIYLIPAVVSAATVVLAVLCLLKGLEEIEHVFPGFFFHADGTVAPMQRGGWEGPAAGIRPGDRVLSVQGEALPNGEELSRWLTRRRAGERAVFEIRRPGSQRSRSVELRLRHLTTADILATFVLPYSIGVVYLLLGAVIFFVKRTYEAALAMSLCVVASVYYMSIFDAHTGFTFLRLWVSYPLLGAISIHLFSVFPARRPGFHRAWVLALPYTITAIIVAISQVTFRKAAYADVSSVTNSTFLASCFLIDVLLLTRTVRRDSSEEVRNKAKTIRAGLLATVAAAVLWILFARGYPEVIAWEWAMLLSAAFPIVFAYAVIKKNLFDMDLVLRTTTTYVIATGLVVALYFAGVSIIGLAMSAWTQRFVGPQQSLVAAVISTLVVALLFHPLRLGVQRVVDRFFFREKGVLEEALVGLARDLATRSPRLSEVAERLTAQARELFRCQYAMLLCLDLHGQEYQVAAVAGTATADVAGLSLPQGSELARFLVERQEPTSEWPGRDDPDPNNPGATLGGAGVSMVVPLSRGTTPVGILLLGPRHHGDAFTNFDLRLMRTLAPTAALVLENSLLLREHAGRERLAALGKLSTVLIHEIKNPLGIIRVSSGTLRKRFESGDPGHELASFIEEEVVRMNETVAQFLTFARPREPVPSSFDLSELVQRTATAARADLEQAGVALAVQAPEAVEVHADADQVQQVLLNLLVNAKQALEGRDEGTVRLSVVGPAGPAHTRASLVVADNGSGIDPADQDRIFEPFFTTRRGGTGLGLAIARQLLGEQGGAIKVRSTSEGTEFVVSLPV